MDIPYPEVTGEVSESRGERPIGAYGENVVEQILTDVFRVEIPIPENPLGSTNSYVVKGPERNLIVDTGLGGKESMEAARDALGSLAVDLERTDFFITHLHPDHFGLVSGLAQETARVYVSRREMGWFDVVNPLDRFFGFARLHGFSDEDLDRARREIPDFESARRRDPVFHFLKEAETIELGDMVLRCVETPGHTQGHLCLFEPEKRILFAGDHILPTISPVIEFMRVDGWDPLRAYLASLDIIHDLDIDLVLPGHGTPFRNHRVRVEELKAHHYQRLGDVRSLLKKGPQTAFQLASCMTWNVRHASWDLFPIFEKIIAVGETVSHLAYLVQAGDVGMEAGEDHVAYSLMNVDGIG